MQQFEEWISNLRHHRLYRQHEISFGSKDVPKLIDVTTPVDDFSPVPSPLLSPGSPGKAYSFTALSITVLVRSLPSPPLPNCCHLVIMERYIAIL